MGAPPPVLHRVGPTPGLHCVASTATSTTSPCRPQGRGNRIRPPRAGRRGAGRRIQLLALDAAATVLEGGWKGSRL
jgi:hypothetical protein